MFYVSSENIKPIDSNIVTKLTPLQETMKVHQVVLVDKHLLKHRVLSCFCRNLKGHCKCYCPKLHKFEIIAKPEIESKTTDYKFQLDTKTGVLWKVKTQIDKHRENEQVEDEDVLV